MSNTVKFFHSGLAGAPVLSGTVGAMIAVLDACLVNGWGSATVDSVVISGGVATVTRSAGHPFQVDCVSEIAGATVTGGSINGQKKVLSAVGNTYTFDATGIPNQTATGTITHKFAAAGWEKSFTGTNIAAYRSLDVTGRRMYVRVDDTGTTNARVVGYETMSDVNTGTGPFPNSGQQSGGLFWPKSNSASATACSWVVFADANTFYLLENWEAGTSNLRHGSAVGFGDMVRAGSTDQYAAFIHGTQTSQTSAAPGGTSHEMDYWGGTAGTSYAPRPSSGLGSSTSLVRYYPLLRGGSSGFRSGDNTPTVHIPFPNASDSGLYLSPFNISNVANGVHRGRSPGMYAIPQSVIAGTFDHLARVTNLEGLIGRAVRIINSSVGAYAFDATGPWT